MAQKSFSLSAMIVEYTCIIIISYQRDVVIVG